ncbi:hypothetical protein F8S13_02590 [Chloroflexia bacterium SDU3-3]|nr:hypothetical protein F8S13_02590 [Chloroflexia bacterium SDU3-3]
MTDETHREKPYDFVPISSTAKNSLAAGHHLAIGSSHARLLTGMLSAKIISESLVHVGSGYVVSTSDILRYGDVDRSTIKDDTLVASHVRSQGKRYIPGSTLKGVIRSAVEAITLPGIEFSVESSKKTVRGVHVQQLRMKYRQQELHKSPADPIMPLANRLFGLTSADNSYQGQCSFLDAYQVSGNAMLFRRLPLYRPQPDYSEGDPSITTGWEKYFLDRNRSRVRGRKFYRSGDSREVERPYTAVEACSIGSEFHMQIMFRNLTMAELGIILIVFGADQDILRLKVGGGKPVSMGTIRFTDIALSVVDYASYTDFERVDSVLSVSDCVKAANESNEIDESSRKKLAEIMREPAKYVAGGSDRIY